MDIIKIETKALDLRIDKPGIYDMTRAQYHSDPCVAPSLSRSCIVTMLEKSPLHAAYEHARISLPDADGVVEDDEEEVEKENAARTIGDYADFLITGGEGKVFAVLPFDKWTTKEAKEAKAAALARGDVPIKKKYADKAEKMVKVFRAKMNTDVFPELIEGFPADGFQRVVIWNDGGVWCRAMLDSLARHIWDYKTTAADAAPRNWIRNQLFGGGLDIQSAFYSRGVKAVTGESKHFIFAVQEQNAPFDCYPVVVDPEDLRQANIKIDWARDQFAAGLASGVWPGYLRRIATAQAPVYLRTQWEEFIEGEKTLQKITATEAKFLPG